MYIIAPKIAIDPMNISELIISALILFSESLLLAIIARLTSKELCQLYCQNGKCVRCGSQDYFVRNGSLAPANAASSGSGKLVMIAVINDDSGSDFGNDSGVTGEYAGVCRHID